FGGGGGGGPFGIGGTSGFGGGTGGSLPGGLSSGGGGGGMGGAVFVMAGGQLTLDGTLTVSGSAVSAGAGGSTGTPGAAGGAYGAGLFLAGNGTLTFAPAIGQTQTVHDAIADQNGSGGTGPTAGVWGLAMSGEGTLVLAGANTYSGPTTVSAGVGTLQVDGSVAGPVSLGSGATLQGAGRVGSLQVSASSVFRPGYSGGGSTAGTLTAGALSFEELSTYQVAVNLSSTTGTTAAVMGTAQLDGTVQVDVTGTSLNRPLSISILHAGAISGTFSGVTLTNAPAGLEASLQYNATDVILTLTP
ncbi:MAG TPA: autotransporter-associated beta strand repeat-containing protein, partial [Rhodothermales bacterium]|nr:autotransporter-associated beta strand repeat-containing protein [Rhodothermales bacterium]